MVTFASYNQSLLKEIYSIKSNGNKDDFVGKIKWILANNIEKSKNFQEFKKKY